MAEKTKLCSFRFDCDFLEDLKDYSKKHDLSQRQVIERACIQYMYHSTNENIEPRRVNKTGSKTILQVSHELGFTKNAVKYHVKCMPDNFKWTNSDGRIFITLEGVEWLRNKMQRSKAVCKTINVYEEIDLLKAKVDTLINIDNRLLSLVRR